MSRRFIPLTLIAGASVIAFGFLLRENLRSLKGAPKQNPISKDSSSVTGQPKTPLPELFSQITQEEELGALTGIDTNDWNRWQSKDFGPGCIGSEYCYDPMKYQLHVSFSYPAYLNDGGYQDMGGGLQLYSDDIIHNNEFIYIDCSLKSKGKLDRWMGLPPPPSYYRVVLDNDVVIGEFPSTESVLVITKDASQIRREHLDIHRDVRFYMEKYQRSCQIQSTIDVSYEVIRMIISSFKGEV